jgi:hypothetical protein
LERIFDKKRVAGEQGIAIHAHQRNAIFTAFNHSIVLSISPGNEKRSSLNIHFSKTGDFYDNSIFAYNFT